MIKGCHKNVVFLKDTGSEFFDEAYFIVKPNAKNFSGKDIVTEATKLVNTYSEKKKEKKKTGKLLAFCTGVILGFAIMLFLHFTI